MLPPSMISDWARNLIAAEADATTAQNELATLRVYERLRLQFRAPVGVDAFQALASRALSVARSQFPILSAASITANGDLRGFGEVEVPLNSSEEREVGIILIAQMLRLLLTLLGETATVRLIEDAPLTIETKSELNTTGTTTPARAPPSRCSPAS